MLQKQEPTVKLEDPTYGIKTEPLYQGYEERLMSSMEPDELINESKSCCQICDHPIAGYPTSLCKVCEKKFEFDQGLNIQKKKKRTIVKYQCGECSKSFSNVNTYQRHIKCHDEKKPYRCHKCEKRFYHSKNLAEHMEIHDTSFTVPAVPTASQSSVFLINTSDESTHDTGVKIKLEKVDEECNNFNAKDPKVNLKSAMKSTGDEHESRKVFQSPCNLTMVQIENFELFNPERESETVDMDNGIFYEDDVPTGNTETYESIIKIEAETLLSTDGYEAFTTDTNETTECEIREELPDHDRNEEAQRECYICKHCNKDFMYFGNYAKHLEQHSIGKLMCKFCNQMFGSTYQIRKHIRDYHSNQEMFDCSVCFTTLPKHYFASHMRTHRSDDKTLICKYCGSRFSEPSELFYHFKNRHSDSVDSNVTAHGKGYVEAQPIQPIEDIMGVEKYRCKYCGLMFDDVIKMYHHVKVHAKRTG